MKFSSAAVLSWILGASVLVVPALAADPPAGFKGCGTVARPELIDGTERVLGEQRKAEARLGRRQGGVSNYVFDVYWHSIAANMTIAGGWVPQSQIDAQMKMINDAYVGTGVSWNLVNVTRVLSRYWHETVDMGELQTLYMQASLRTGDAKSLNVYSVGFYGMGINGYSSFPFDYADDPISDGVVLLYETVPGGTSQNRQGGTLLHEAGHWLGLYHTFQGGCTGRGDLVDDTPPGAEANFGCPIGVDSCLGDSSPDPIHNYMDYTDETCRTEFTPGQIDRMQEAIRAFRS